VSQSEPLSSEFLPTTYLTVLTIIADGAEYGYEINNIIEKFGYHEWVDLRFSSVYKALSELEKRGLIEGRKKDKSVKTSKKIYRMTRKGKKVLNKQIKMCLSSPPRSKTLFDLGIAGMSFLTQEEALDALRTYKSSLETNLKFLESNIQNYDNIERLRMESPGSRVGNITVEEFDNLENIGAVRALFDRPAWTIRCQINWLESFIKQVEIGDSFTFKQRKKK
jgi:DNA-binding PadR family transcriptional regulator